MEAHVQQQGCPLTHMLMSIMSRLRECVLAGRLGFSVAEGYMLFLGCHVHSFLSFSNILRSILNGLTLCQVTGCKPHNWFDASHTVQSLFRYRHAFLLVKLHLNSPGCFMVFPARMPRHVLFCVCKSTLVSVPHMSWYYGNCMYLPLTMWTSIGTGSSNTRHWLSTIG